MRRIRKIFLGVAVFAGLCAGFAVWYPYHIERQAVQTVEAVLERAAADASDMREMELEELLETLEEYKPYFTEEGWDRAVQTRELTKLALGNGMGENLVSPASLSLKETDRKGGDISFAGWMTAEYGWPDGKETEQGWNIRARLVKEDGEWRIQYLTVDPRML